MIKKLAISTLLVLNLSACQICTDLDHSSENALDWAATYRGNPSEYPNMMLTLDYNHSYKLTASNIPTTTGTFKWEQCGSVVRLDNKMRFGVGESHIRLIVRDKSHYQENSPYVLEKQIDQ